MISHLGCRRLSTLPRLVEDMRRSTRSPTFPLMDFIAVSQFAFLCPVFANCVSFFPFLIHFPQPNWNDIMPRGSQTEYVPTRPCRRTRDRRQEGPLLTGGWFCFPVGKLLFKMSFLSIPLGQVLHMRRRLCSLREQMGWRGFDEKEQNEEAINISR